MKSRDTLSVYFLLEGLENIPRKNRFLILRELPRELPIYWNLSARYHDRGVRRILLTDCSAVNLIGRLSHEISGEKRNSSIGSRSECRKVPVMYLRCVSN